MFRNDLSEDLSTLNAHWGDLTEHERNIADTAFQTLIRTWIFAEKYEMRELCDLAMYGMIDHLQLCSFPVALVNEVYADMGSVNKLRLLTAGSIAFDLSYGDWRKEVSEEIPKNIVALFRSLPDFAVGVVTVMRLQIASKGDARRAEYAEQALFFRA